MTRLRNLPTHTYTNLDVVEGRVHEDAVVDVPRAALHAYGLGHSGPVDKKGCNSVTLKKKKIVSLRG